MLQIVENLTLEQIMIVIKIDSSCIMDITYVNILNNQENVNK
jgi:hypothetical protein